MRVGRVGEALEERRPAFQRLTQERLDRAYRLACALLSDREEAQDAVHDAVEQAVRDQDRLRDLGAFDAWFDAIVVHRCRDRIRRRRVRPVPVPELPEIPAPDSIARSVERDALRGALAGLDLDHRIVVLLRFAADLTIAEIAARTGAREGTVKSRLHYALRELRAAYDAADRTNGNAG